MKKLLQFISLFLFISSHTTSQVSNIKWIKTAIGAEDELPRVVKTDHEGNVYVAGEFDSNNLLIDGINLTNLADSSLNSISNLFLIKYSPEGILEWAKAFQSDGSHSRPKIDISSSGKIVLACDLNVATFLLYDNKPLKLPKKSIDFFIAELNSDGELLWSKSFYDVRGGSSISAGIKYTIDDYIIIGGSYGTTLIDEVDSIVFQGATINNYSFLIKLNNKGNILWSKLFGSGAFTYFSNLTLDNSNNIIVYGVFQGNHLILDNFTINNKSKLINGIYDMDIFLGKLDSDGNTIWLKSIYGSKYDVSADKIVTDSFGNIYPIGIYESDTIYFDSNVKLLKSGPGNNSWDLFYSKYDKDGNFRWAKKIDNGVAGSIDYIIATVSPNGNLFLAANYDEFAFKKGEIVLPSYGQNDIFYLECDTLGNIVSKGSLGSDDIDYISDIHLDNQANLYLLGAYGSNEIKIGNAILHNTSQDGSLDMYLIKISPDSISSTFNNHGKNEFEISLNSKSHTLQINCSKTIKKCDLSIFNIAGQLMFNKNINDVSENNKLIILPDLLKGVYLINLKTDKEVITKRFIYE